MIENYPLSITFEMEMVVTGSHVDLQVSHQMPALLAAKIKSVAQEFFNEENASKNGNDSNKIQD